ncbi:MAG: hypothetical protein SFW62_04530 [Alphaproteobacteria bacterium]|nr:hypothetical protein [Alphaproteobacteria bacterium]
MLNAHEYAIPSSLLQSIEDAILLGHVKEIDAVLSVIEYDEDFPKELRYGLEALRHFRAHYGKNGPLQPREKIQQQKAALMESAWGSELLEMLKHEESSVAVRKA